jgi:nitroreductase
MDKVIAARQAGIDPIPRGAPVLIVVHAPSDYMGGAIDSTIALTTLDLAAPRLGLGTCWAGFFQIAATMWPPLQLALELPAGHAATGSMMLGFPKFRYQRVVQRQPVRVNWR